MVQYCLSNGVVEEAASAFTCYGYFLIALDDKFDEGRRMGEIANAILDNSTSTFARRKCMCLLRYVSMFHFIADDNVNQPCLYIQFKVINYSHLQGWFRPHCKTASMMVGLYSDGMKGGDVNYAAFALHISVLFSFFGGEHLSLLSKTATRCLGLMVYVRYLTFHVILTITRVLCHRQSTIQLHLEVPLLILY